MMMKIKCCNGTCFYIISFRLVLDRKDFEQANTDGHKNSVIIVQCYPHQQKFYCVFKCLEI